MRAAGAAIAALLAGSLPASATDLSYRIINDSDLTIMEVYASPAGEDRWGEDLLRARVLPRGEMALVSIPDGQSRCDYDLRLILEDGRELDRNTQVCDTPSYTVRGTP